MEDHSSKDGGIGDQKGACWVSFTDRYDGKDESGVMEYGVKDGVLYEFEMYYRGTEKADNVSNEILNSVDFDDE